MDNDGDAQKEIERKMQNKRAHTYLILLRMFVQVRIAEKQLHGKKIMIKEDGKKITENKSPNYQKYFTKAHFSPKCSLLCTFAHSSWCSYFEFT